MAYNPYYTDPSAQPQQGDLGQSQYQSIWNQMYGPRAGAAGQSDSQFGGLGQSSTQPGVESSGNKGMSGQDIGGLAAGIGRGILSYAGSMANKQAVPQLNTSIQQDAYGRPIYNLPTTDQFIQNGIARDPDTKKNAAIDSGANAAVSAIPGYGQVFGPLAQGGELLAKDARGNEENYIDNLRGNALDPFGFLKGNKTGEDWIRSIGDPSGIFFGHQKAQRQMGKRARAVARLRSAQNMYNSQKTQFNTKQSGEEYYDQLQNQYGQRVNNLYRGYA